LTSWRSIFLRGAAEKLEVTRAAKTFIDPPKKRG